MNEHKAQQEEQGLTEVVDSQINDMSTYEFLKDYYEGKENIYE